jgi:peroxiredoxin
VLDTVKSPQRTRPPQHAGELESIVLTDQHGERVRLGDMWQDKPAVLVFLRHYGCVFCRHYATMLHHDRQKFEAQGLRLAVVGQGTPAHAREFQRAQSVELPLLVDEDREAYRAAGTKVGTLNEVFGLRSLRKGARWTITSRIRQGSIAVHQSRTIGGSTAQLGGVLVIAPDSSVRYAHLSELSGDDPPVAEVLAAAKAIRPRVDGAGG